MPDANGSWLEATISQIRGRGNRGSIPSAPARSSRLLALRSWLPGSPGGSIDNRRTRPEVSMQKQDLVADFSATDQDGAEVTLTGLLENGPLVLFFYPKAMTPG